MEDYLFLVLGIIIVVLFLWARTQQWFINWMNTPGSLIVMLALIAYVIYSAFAYSPRPIYPILLSIMLLEGLRRHWVRYRNHKLSH